MAPPRTRITLVEDDPAHAAAIQRALQTADGDYAVQVCGTLRAFRESAAANPPDLVLMDLNLPDGQAVEALTAPPEARPYPILVMTSYGTEQIAVSILKAGALDYVVKSAEAFADLPHTVARAMREWQQLQARQQAEARLRESEERHRTILQTALDGFWMLDLQGRLLEVNAAYCQMSGYCEAELLTMGAADLEALETPAEATAHIQKVMAQGAERFESRHRRKDGSRFDVEVSVQYRAAEGGQLVAFLRDITARKQAEEALRESEDKFRSTIQQASDGIVLCDARGQIIEWNRSQETIFGWPREQIIGTRLWDFQYSVVPEARRDEALRQRLKRVILDAGQLHNVEGLYNSNEMAVVSAAGESKTVQVTTFIIHTQRGPLYAALTRDVTARKQAEEALRRLNAELEERVAARTAELHATNQQLVAALRAKDQFLATMSHELRTPLTAILGLAELLQMRAYGPLTEKQAGYAQTIYQSGQHLLELINDVLDLAKLAAGQTPLEIGSVDIPEICQAARQLIQPQAEKKHQAVSLVLDPAATRLQADGRRLKQILINLLSNAIKFTPDGGKVGLAVSGDETRGQVEFTVWDTGIGIAAEDLPRLFQDFVQLDARLAREYEGTGLGLALVRRLTELHGGQVKAESDGLDKGSRFTVSLPQPTAAPPSRTGLSSTGRQL